MEPGRPRRAVAADPAAEPLARTAAHELAAKTRRRSRAGEAEGSEHLRLAVAAARIAAAAERLARTHVTRARQADGVTWEEVGAAFGTSRQSAHERFRSAGTPLRRN